MAGTRARRDVPVFAQKEGARLKEQLVMSSNPQPSLPSCPTYHGVGYLFFEFWPK